MLMKDEPHSSSNNRIWDAGLNSGETFYEWIHGDNISNIDNPLIMSAIVDKLSWTDLR